MNSRRKRARLPRSIVDSTRRFPKPEADAAAAGSAVPTPAAVESRSGKRRSCSQLNPSGARRPLVTRAVLRRSRAGRPRAHEPKDLRE